MYDLSFNLENNRCINSSLMVSKERLYGVCFFKKFSCKVVQENADSNNFETF